jgi:hypothetical protein
MGNAHILPEKVHQQLRASCLQLGPLLEAGSHPMTQVMLLSLLKWIWSFVLALTLETFHLAAGIDKKNMNIQEVWSQTQGGITDDRLINRGQKHLLCVDVVCCGDNDKRGTKKQMRRCGLSYGGNII